MEVVSCAMCFTCERHALGTQLPDHRGDYSCSSRWVALGLAVANHHHCWLVAMGLSGAPSAGPKKRHPFGCQHF